jgi:hypothetical protein
MFCKLQVFGFISIRGSFVAHELYCVLQPREQHKGMKIQMVVQFWILEKTLKM